MPRKRPDPRYEDWTVSGGEHAMLVGTVTGGGGQMMPIYYEEDAETFFGAEVDERNEILRRLDEYVWQHRAEEELGAAIERIGDELEWESLSAFAEEHLEGASDGTE